MLDGNVLQKQFSELLMKAASDYGALTASVADFQWSQNFKESPSVWGVNLNSLSFILMWTNNKTQNSSVDKTKPSKSIVCFNCSFRFKE